MKQWIKLVGYLAQNCMNRNVPATKKQMIKQLTFGVRKKYWP